MDLGSDRGISKRSNTRWVSPWRVATGCVTFYGAGLTTQQRQAICGP